MRKLITLSLVALFALGTMSLALAGEEKAGRKDMRKVAGEIVSVDSNAKTLVVKETPKEGGEARELTFTFDETTKIMLNEKAAAVTDVQTGDTVTIHYQSKEGKNIAHEIVVARKQ